MSVLLASSAIVTCLGDGDATYAALCAGRSGVGPLRHADAGALNVAAGYHIDDGPDEPSLRAGRWLTGCVADALAAAGVVPGRERVVAIVGTGLRELRAVERWAADDVPFATEALHFGAAVTAGAPGIEQVYTVANACSAGGFALALGQDLLETRAADAVVVGAADTMTESMLSMIGRVSDEPSDHLRPFDRERGGVVLGDGAAAAVLVPEGRCPAPLARVLATGLSCDAGHATAPDAAGIARAIEGAFARADRRAADVDLVFAHGTGTGRNDPTELEVLRAALGPGSSPRVTAIKGAIGHTSGASALHSLAVAANCLRTGIIPPIVGLREPIPGTGAMRLVTGGSVTDRPRLIQINAFGFGGVNAVTLVEAVR